MKKNHIVKNLEEILERLDDMSKIILSADSTCDLSVDLKEQYEVNYFPFHIILEEVDYLDNVDITPEKIYDAYYERKVLPKTAAINMAEYMEYFEKWVKEGYEVIHICLGSGLSCAYQNCVLAAEELGHVHVINSGNLSTGMGLLVIEAGKMIQKGLEVEEIVARLKELVPKCHASFILDTLEFMRAGGRCSAATAFGANLLNIKPCIEVNNKDGSMSVGKKYRGSLESVLKKYVKDKIEAFPDMKKEVLFITHSGISEDYIQLVKGAVSSLVDVKEIYVTKASCTISSHCGPNTLGILFETK